MFRSYPLGETASHALGYMGRINTRDLERIDEEGQAANYRGTDHIGKTGLEQRYEFEMHGTSGFESVEVDAGGRGIRVLSRTPPVSGNNLNLTIDAKLQQVAETAFGKRRGALVAIDPENGEILALVSMPTYDPNLFVDGIRSDDWDVLNTDINKPLLNRAIYSAYPPGSTFKPFMALGALTAGKRTPQQSISDPGYFNFGNHTFRDDKKGGHGMVNMYTSIVHSCDTYYYVLANEWGIEGLSDFMGRLGFGSKTGIDIDGESRGILPSPAWKERRFKRPEQQKWYAGETISIGLGQGYNSYTMMQLAQATAMLANNGVGYKPHLVRSITDPRSGRCVRYLWKRRTRSRLSPSTLKSSKTPWWVSTRKGPVRRHLRVPSMSLPVKLVRHRCLASKAVPIRMAVRRSSYATTLCLLRLRQRTNPRLRWQ